MTDRPLTDYIRTIPDFPVPGVQFRDVTTLFAVQIGPVSSSGRTLDQPETDFLRRIKI